METEIISVRVRKGTSIHLKKLGVNSSQRVRRYLENLAWREEARRAIDELEKVVKKHSKPSKVGFTIESIREDRNAAH